MPLATADNRPVLAIETATNCGSLALLIRGQCLAEHSLLSGASHSRRLLTAIETLLAESDLSWPDLRAVAVSIGPGSFTGLRIGMATAKGLCLATGTPLIGVPTLDGLAGQLPFASFPVCPLLDARKGEIYTAFYRTDRNGLPERTSQYLALTPEQLAARIKEPAIFLGNALTLYGRQLADQLGPLMHIAPQESCFVRAAGIGRIALHLLETGTPPEPAATLPLYVRASDAELQLGKKTVASPS